MPREPDASPPSNEPLPTARPRPLNEVFAEWCRRLQDPGIALAEFNRALREGELIASLYEEGRGLRALERSYWRRARVEFDREYPIAVVVVIGDEPQPAGFYISPASHSEQHRKPLARNSAGRAESSGATKILSEAQIKRAKTYFRGMLDKDPSWADRIEKSARKVTVDCLKLDERSWQTVKADVILPVLKERGQYPKRRKSQKK